MKKLSVKIITSIIILILLVVVGLYLQKYMHEKRNQVRRDFEESQSISKTHSHQKSNKIYQNNKLVGEIVGEIKKIDETDILFEQLNETSALQKKMPIEYQGVKYVIIRMDNFIKEYQGEKSEKIYDILQGVTCRKVK